MNIIEWIRIVVIGIVEGVSEWLPISSTGHMLLVEAFWKTGAPSVITNEFWQMFLYVIQLGAILAVVTFFFHKLNPLSPRKNPQQKRETWALWINVIIGSLPAAVLGLLFDDTVSSYLQGPLVIATTLIVYGILFIVVENRYKQNKPSIISLKQLDLKTVLIIGFAQVLAMIPGTSRSGITIVVALLIGCSRYVAAEFTFFLAIPVMFGVSALKIGKYVLGGPGFVGPQLAILLLGMIVAYIVSVVVIRFLMNYIKKHDFKIFGYYRIALGLVVIAVTLFTSVL